MFGVIWVDGMLWVVCAMTDSVVIDWQHLVGRQRHNSRLWSVACILEM